MKGLLIFLGVCIAALGLFIGFADYYWTWMWWELRANAFWIIPVVVILVLILIAIGIYESGGSGGAAGALAGLTLLFGIGTVIYWFGYNYWQEARYVASIEVTDNGTPELEPRTPFSISAVQVRANLGDNPGDLQSTMYVPADETFATLVEARGFATGYSTLLEQQITAEARNRPVTCDFDQARAGARLGGVFGGNLGRQINTEQRYVTWDNDDAYGWCDPEGTPFVVVPLVQQTGFWVVTEEAAGVALYNGLTGEIDVRESAEGIPGPTYPLHLAEHQRGSTTAINGFWDWMYSRAGWELPDEADSINSSNQSEFVLSGPGGDEYYVTPMSGRGAATALSAMAVMDAELTEPGLATLTVHRLDPDWTSATGITDRIRATFGDVFAQQRDAGIYELAPTGNDTWSATIGTPQNVLYRVTGYGDLREEPCLNDLAGQVLRCGPTGNIGVSTGSTPTTPPVAGAPAASDLSTLTPEQLADLQRRVADEWLRRNTGG